MVFRNPDVPAPQIKRQRRRFVLCNLFSFLSSFFPAIRLFVSACFTFCFPFSFFFSLLELRYSHQLIFTSLCLFSLLTTAICCLPTPARHISKSLFSSITSSAMFSFNHPLKKYMHLQNNWPPIRSCLLFGRAVTTASAANSSALGVAKGCRVNS